MFRNVQTVMIVKSDGREAKYAQLLFQLVGELPNFESSHPVTEAQYKESCLTIDGIANDKVIFFGNGKEAEIQGKSVNWQYDRFGMRYGWLGNRCVITADPGNISLKEQSSFAEYYNSRIEEFRSIIELQHIHYSETETPNDSVLDDEIQWQDTDDAADKTAKTAAAVIRGVPIVFLKMMKGAVDTVENIRATFERADLWERQYELLVCEYILNGFPRFMNNTTEKNAKKKAIIVYSVKDSEHAHLLHNLIQQYSGYDVGEYTEKMFIDNAPTLSSKNKIIFLGNTKSSKERCVKIEYTYDETGMRYGWRGNQAFINVSALKKSERSTFIEVYRQKSKEYKDKAKDYTENNNFVIGKRVAKGLNIAGAVSLFNLPGLFTYAMGAGINYGLGVAMDKAINNANTISNLSGYQYQLLLREFVFNSFEKFMEEA